MCSPLLSLKVQLSIESCPFKDSLKEIRNDCEDKRYTSRGHGECDPWP